jgi:hypothetical protein
MSKSDAVHAAAIRQIQPTNIDDVTNLIKSKYFENLEVVEKLANEKAQLEQRMREMERSLRASQEYSSSPFRTKSSMDSLPYYDSADENEDNYVGDNNDEYDLIYQDNRRSAPPQRSSRSPTRLAARPKSATTVGAYKRSSFDDDGLGRSSRSAEKRGYGTERVRRSMSATRFSISADLQADIDR